MYINSVLSFLGGWRELGERSPHLISDIEKTLSAFSEGDHLVQSTEMAKQGALLVSPKSLHQTFRQQMGAMGWELGARDAVGRAATSPFIEIDAVKEGVGVELIIGKWAFVGSSLLTKFPFFIRAKRLQTAVVLVPMKALTRSMSTGVSSYELMRELLSSVPLPLKYPFAIVGFSPERIEPLVVNLMTEMDDYLVQNVGYTLNEMLLLHEMDNFDFKAKFTGGARFNETVCAFSNLPTGGMFLFGVTDDCAITGLPKGKELDGIKLGISNLLGSSKHSPTPRYSLRVFDAPADPDLCILIMRVHGVERRPCTFDGRVYVRSGPSTQLATPEQIRRLVLG